MASPQTIQPAGADTYLQEANASNNYGTSVNFIVNPQQGAVYYNRNAIIKFDFSAVVPAGATITLATFSLYCITSMASRTITVSRLLRTDWVETQATWNIYKTGSNWGTAGASNTASDITTTDAATANTVAVNNWLNVTVTAQVQTALDSVSGVAHFHVADVTDTTDGTLYNNYHSSNYTTDTTQRPKLYIEYTEPAVGPANLKSYNTNLKANVKSINTNVIANVKTLNTNV